jgi:hypothetical protein
LFFQRLCAKWVQSSTPGKEPTREAAIEGLETAANVSRKKQKEWDDAAKAKTAAQSI